ncbi:hypothetical protein J7L27_02015 [Candidatus Bathyarchaeota archaeon]|nr:hypothetical protein [Candidatus Bathyarchaeota archaeon]
MEPLNIIYWTKVALGFLAAVICLLLKINNIFSGITIGILVYLVGDRILRHVFIAKVDEQSTITKTGVGTYIITWIFFWILLYTLFNI